MDPDDPSFDRGLIVPLSDMATDRALTLVKN